MKQIAQRTKIIYSDCIIITTIILAAIPPRMWNLTKFPQPIVDEASNIRQLSTLLFANGFYPTRFAWDGSQATLFYYPTIALIRVFTIYDIFLGLRLTSVIFSLAALIPFYFLVKRFSTKSIAFCTTLLFSYSYYYLQFSRVGWSAIYALTIGLYLLWTALASLEKKSPLLITLSGVMAGLGFYTYQLADIYIATAIIILGYTILQWNKKIQTRIWYIACFAIPFFCITIPWVLQIFSHWNTFTLRATTVSIFSQSFPYHRLSNPVLIIFYQLSTTLLSWVFLLPIQGGGIENSRYLPGTFPIISPFLIPFVFMGITVSFKKWKRLCPILLVFALGLLGQVLTVNPPNGARGLVLLPVLYIFIAQGVYFIYKRYPSHTSQLQKGMILATLIIACTDFLFYAYWMSWIRIVTK